MVAVRNSGNKHVRARPAPRHRPRHVTRAPNDTDATDVQAMLDAGYEKRQVLAITVYVALRVAFSTVNDARRPT